MTKDELRTGLDRFRADHPELLRKITITTTFGIEVNLDAWAEAYGASENRQAAVQDVLNYYDGLADEVHRIVTRPANGSRLVAQTTQLGGIPETIKVRYRYQDPDDSDGCPTWSGGELELPHWCSGDPSSAVAMYLFGYAKAAEVFEIETEVL